MRLINTIYIKWLHGLVSIGFPVKSNLILGFDRKKPLFIRGDKVFLKEKAQPNRGSALINYRVTIKLIK